MAERVVKLGLPHLFSATKATLNPNHGYTASDLISAAGLALIFPEITKNRITYNAIMALISLGTTLDNAADEGGEVDSYDVGKPNSLQFDFIREMIQNTYSIPVSVQQNVGGFLRQCWAVEQYGHDHVDLSSEDQITYREAINAVWTRTYVSIVSGVAQRENSVDKLGNYFSPSFANGLPTYKELIKPGNETYDLIAPLYRNYIDGNYEDAPCGALSYTLFLLVMETSNWYDTQLNTLKNFENTPRIRNHTRRYRDKLAAMGISPHFISSIFLAAKVAMAAMSTRETFHRLRSSH